MTNKYLRELRDQDYNRKAKYSSHPNVGDVILLQDNTVKRRDRKIRKIAELIISIDKSIRAAKIDETLNDIIIISKRPINKLFPVEYSNQHTIKPTFVNEKNIPQVAVGVGGGGGQR